MTLLEFYAFRSSLYLNYSVLIFAFQVCNQNLVIKIYCDRDRNFLVRHRFFGFRATVDCSLRKHVDRQPNFRPRMEACETEDGGWLLGFYTLEAEEEIRGVGFVNHQLTRNLWQHVGQWPPCVVVRVSENGDQTLGFCILEAEEGIYGIGFAEGLRKTNRSQGRLRLVRQLWLLIATMQRQRGLVEVVKVAVVLNWTMVCLVDQFGSRDGEGRGKRDEKLLGFS